MRGLVAATVAGSLVLAAAVITGLAGTPDAGAVTGSAGTFQAVAPARVLDTRAGLGALAPGAYATVALPVLGRGGVPGSGVSAVVLNITVTTPAAAGFITVFPGGSPRPVVSNLNFTPGETVPNLVVAPVGADGKVDLFNGSAGATQLIADVAGYFSAGAAVDPGSFVPVVPSRLMDTRVNLGAHSAAAGSRTVLPVTAHAGIPATGVSAVVMNVTTTSATASGYISVYPDGSTLPNVSNLNFSNGQTVPNLVVVPVGPDGAVDFYNGSGGTTQLIADVAGYFLAGTPSNPGAYAALTPARILDTRSNFGGSVAASHATVALAVEGHGGVPATGVRAVVLNLTAVAPTSGGFVTAYADGAAFPNASNLNFTEAETVPNLVVVPVGADGKVNLFNGSAGTVQLIADVAGYFVGAPGEPAASCAGFTNTTGITDSTITLANATDETGPVPGLYASAQQATQAYVDYFNSVSSICGRTLTLDTLDTQTTASGDQQASATACATAFAMVGSMSDYDDGGASTAAQCAIPDIRTQPNSTARQDATDTYAAGYGDLEQAPVTGAQYFAQTFPAATAHLASLYLNAATYPAHAQAEMKAWQQAGTTFVYTAGIDVAAFNYSTYVNKMVALGVKYALFTGPYQYAVKLATALTGHGIGLILDSSAYTPGFVSTGGAAAEGSYVVTNTALFEEAATNPEMQLYEHWLQIATPGATPSTAGLFAWSAARLFTEQAVALGGTLSRSALLTALRTVHGWTGNGLFAPQDVGNKTTSGCTAVIQLENGAWIRRSPGQYVCGPVVQTGAGP